MDFKDKKVLVFGSGISGIGACELLEKSGATVILFDGNEKLHEEAIRMKLPSASKAQILIGQISDEQLKELDLVVLSPGVPTDLPVVEKMKAGIPNLTLSTDIIVGFPGETEEDFTETLDVVEKCKYDSAFTFIYSPRENTPAAKMNDPIPLSVKQERLQRLNEIVNKYALINNEKLVGQVVPVLIEGESQKGNGLYAGYTDTMKLTNVKCDKEDIGKIINVKITESKTWSLNGEKE